MSPILQSFELFDAVAKVRTNHGGIMTPAARLAPEGEEIPLRTSAVLVLRW